MANRSTDEDKIKRLSNGSGGKSATPTEPWRNRDITAVDITGAEGASPPVVSKYTASAPTTQTYVTQQAPATTQLRETTSGGGGATSPATQLSTERNLIDSLGNYDPSAYASYQEALRALETARGQIPVYNDTYTGQLNDLYAQITGREPFRYDVDSDPLYQQYRDQYTMRGQQAMMDAAGQAAALTGGYGNTYSQAVGQQQYNAYLQDLNQIVPDLYQSAYNRWLNEGDQMAQRYGMLGDLADREYGKYRDQVGDYWTQLDAAQRQAELEYNRGLAEWEREYQLNEDARAQQADDYNRLVQLMQMGYTPNAEEISAAGMSEAEAAAWKKYIKSQTRSSGGGGGGSSSGASETFQLSEKGAKAADYIEELFTTNDYINPSVNTTGKEGDLGGGSLSYDRAQEVAENYLDAAGVSGKEKEYILAAAMSLWGA